MAPTPGFAKITEETLAVSKRIHNEFAPDTAFPLIDTLSNEFQELCAIIVKYDLQSLFRLRLLHRHIMITEGQILLGTSVNELHGYWTKPVYIQDVDLKAIRGHIFSANIGSYNDDKRYTLFPSEYREGPSINIESIDSNFVMEFMDYLYTQGWANTFGLEVIQSQAEKMIEFSFDIGNLLLKEDCVKMEVMEKNNGQFKFQETGWAVKVEDEVMDATGEVRCVTYITGHVKITNSQMNKVSDVIKILEEEDVL